MEQGLIIPASLNQLIRAYNINSVVVSGRNSNPYDGKIDKTVTSDSPLTIDTGYNLLGTTLGNPVYTRLTIQSGSYIDQYGNVQTYPRIDLEGVLLTVHRHKNIVKTEIQGRNGTVKEYIGDSDYEVGISGIITGLNGSYPLSAVQQLNRVLDAQIPLTMTSRYLQTLGINYLVIEDADIDQESGGYAYQKFSMKASSDIAQQIIISE